MFSCNCLYNTVSLAYVTTPSQNSNVMKGFSVPQILCMTLKPG